MHRTVVNVISTLTRRTIVVISVKTGIPRQNYGYGFLPSRVSINKEMLLDYSPLSPASAVGEGLGEGEKAIHGR